jgi:hypothetical protein
MAFFNESLLFGDAPLIEGCASSRHPTYGMQKGFIIECSDVVSIGLEVLIVDAVQGGFGLLSV